MKTWTRYHSFLHFLSDFENVLDGTDCHMLKHLKAVHETLEVEWAGYERGALDPKRVPNPTVFLPEEVDETDRLMTEEEKHLRDIEEQKQWEMENPENGLTEKELAELFGDDETPDPPPGEEQGAAVVSAEEQASAAETSERTDVPMPDAPPVIEPLTPMSTQQQRPEAKSENAETGEAASEAADDEFKTPPSTGRTRRGAAEKAMKRISEMH